MAVARKLFRLAKWFNEYVTITKTLAGNTPNTDKYLTVATRLAFLLYWIFDNLGVLIKIKFINGFDLTNALRRANTFWLLGLALGIITAIRGLINNAKTEAALRAGKSKVGQDGGMEESKYKEEVAKSKAAKLTHILNLIKNLGDCTTASQGLGYPKRFFGFDLNDAVVGLGGFTSAAITCYQTYPAK
jgi:hypothetical protein